MTNDLDGCSEEWGDLWANLPKEAQLVFTRDRPETMSQLKQRAYFNDIWALMGERAATARYCELGAGRGTSSTYLVDKGCDVTMVDLSEAGFGLSRRNFTELGMKWPKMVVADVRETGLPSGAFDCTLSIGLLEHFDEPLPLLKESIRLLDAGGLGYQVIVPTIPPLRAAFTRGVLNPIRFAVNLSGPLRRRLSSQKEDTMIRTSFSNSRWKSWAKEAGADWVECVSYNPYHAVYKSPKLEKEITTRLYWQDYQRRLRTQKQPYLECRTALATCQLLTYGKFPRNRDTN